MLNKRLSSLMDEAGAFFLHVRTGRRTSVISDEVRAENRSWSSFSEMVEDVGQVNLIAKMCCMRESLSSGVIGKGPVPNLSPRVHALMMMSWGASSSTWSIIV